MIQNFLQASKSSAIISIDSLKESGFRNNEAVYVFIQDYCWCTVVQCYGEW
jgi:hypothetical protein